MKSNSDITKGLFYRPRQPSEPVMTHIQFVRACVLLWGETFISRAAAEFGMRETKMQRIVSGSERLYPDTAHGAVALLVERRRSIDAFLDEVKAVRDVAE